MESTLTANTFTVNAWKQFTINQQVKGIDLEKECRRALRLSCTDPSRTIAINCPPFGRLMAQKRHVIAATCEPFTTKNSRYKNWVNLRSRSQLLWIAGSEAKGKTTLAIFLSEELDRMAVGVPEMTVLYYFIDRQDKRDDASYVLRGLITRLIDEKGELFQYLYDEYEIVKDSLFGTNSIEALWRIFEKMLRDPRAGQIYCVLDGLDACTPESLRRLIGRITKFFFNEPQVVIDEDYSNPQLTQRTLGHGLKMMLVSREEPEWLVDHLSEFPRVTWGASKASSSAKPKASKKGPRLADIAQTIIRKQTMENNTTPVESAPSHVHRKPVAGPSSTTIQSPQPLISQTPISPVSPAVSSSPALINFAQMASVEHIERPQTEPAHQTENTPTAGESMGRPTGTQSVPPAAEAVELPATEISQSPGQVASTTSDYVPPATPMGPQDLINQLSQLRTSEPQPPAPLIPQSRIDNTAAPAAVIASNGPGIDPQEVFRLFGIETKTEEPPEYQPGESSASYGADEKPTQSETVEEIHVEEDEEEADDDSYTPSLRLYIESKLSDVAEERKYTTEIQSYITTAIEHRGDGTLLWIDLAIDAIKHVSAEHLESSIGSMPEDLDSMYMVVLLSIPQHLVPLVSGFLRWTVCAVRPLDLLELTVALGLTQSHPNDPLAPILEIAKVCGILFTLDDATATVNIVHSSLVDLVTAENSPLLGDPRLAPFHVRPGDVHRDITHFCIGYLESGCLNAGAICTYENEALYNQRIEQFPFMAYAASFWAQHLRDAQGIFLNLTSPFFVPQSAIRKNWWHTYWAFSTGKGTWMAPRNFNLLHLASYLDLVPLAAQMAQKGDIAQRVNKADSHGNSPIDYSVILGHEAMFRFLHQCGAKMDGGNETLLELACRKGQRDMVALFLDMGFSVNMRAQNVSKVKAMYQMTKHSHGLLNEGFDLNRDAWSMLFRDVGLQETPLHQAAGAGHLTVVELLVQRGAIIEAGTTKNFTPLHAAAYNGQLEVVQFLIDRGANYRAATTDLWLPIHCATLRGKLEVVRLFSELQVPVDSMTAKLKTALHLASYSGHMDIVQHLLERGANLELQSHKGETPLHLATRARKAHVVELLLANGANRNAQTKVGQTPLQIALSMSQAERECAECVRILQTFGTPDYVPWTPPPVVENNVNAASTSADSTTGNSAANTGSVPMPAAPTAPEPQRRGFEPQVRPQVPIIESYQATIHVQGQQQAPPPIPPPEFTSLPQTQSTYPGPFQPQYARHNSEPVTTRFSYDANANLQTTAHVQIPASPPQGPPPPYVPSPQGDYFAGQSEKSPAFTTQPNPPTQWHNTPLAPSTPMCHNNYPSSSGTSPSGLQNPGQPYQAPMTPAPHIIQPSVTPTPYVQSPRIPQAQVFPPQNIPLPQTSFIPPPQPMTAPAAMPYQPPPSPFQVNPVPQPQIYQAPYQQPPSQAYQGQQILNINTNQGPPPQNQYLSPQSSYPQPTYSPQFNGPTTASTYNAGYNYSAPAVNAPYYPNVPNMGPQQNGVHYFSGPPPSPAVGKKKGILGRLMN